ncbi:dimethylarginine dimethylaminohydrolase family protein [Metabacillus litoralis]|uniref:dimethylarginine dimethylaminohydrolase family protein n=1 Tax=Metabacillus TaxID=2675233 RepID=UPI000EF5AB42|nr:dimethylarginine dimethylaminohydrolase family protein [Metabacillus litoralis]MCM3159912.1 dimethylarginine dimethylaminohydrolase family protein [Metabacillus litoralis]MCM3408489.1 dimethylarginine dimethylaminohydrolase family protein [Metabacillus litoralis]UHA59844.1 dimethylarginine dimethylaminohydrolase family protein [Metabacillus litoralis]
MENLDYIKCSCQSEYDTLKKVVLCSPDFMTIKEPINEIQKRFLEENIDTKLAQKQHKDLVKTLKENDVEVILLPPKKDFPEQVFTRDIGFVLGHQVFAADMAHDVRRGEETTFIDYLEKEQVTYTNLIGDKIEGGDVFIDQNTIYVGVSNRTNENAISHLQSLLPTFDVIEVPFTDKYLHLDCVFNILSPEDALIFPNEIEKNKVELLSSRYNLIEVNEEEQATLGTNVLSIGEKRVLSLPINKDVNQKLRERGFHVIEVDITEIIKSGGAFRCCTLPLIRE